MNSFIPRLTLRGGGIVEVVDEILSQDPQAAGLGINWHAFGSNGHVKADFSRGVLERFTRRAPNDWYFMVGNNRPIGGNPHVKSIHNPRRVYYADAHCANYFRWYHSINEHGKMITYFNTPPSDDKIIVNHYYTKSFEEYTTIKRNRKYADKIVGNVYTDGWFKHWDHNEEFDDGILKYRDARAKLYQSPNNIYVDKRLLNALTENLSPTLKVETPQEFYANKLETFLTCRAVSSYLKTKLKNNSQAKFYEEASIKAALKSLVTLASSGDRDLFIRELPELFRLPYPVIGEIYDVYIPQMLDFMRFKSLWRDHVELKFIKDLFKGVANFVEGQRNIFSQPS